MSIFFICVFRLLVAHVGPAVDATRARGGVFRGGYVPGEGFSVLCSELGFRDYPGARRRVSDAKIARPIVPGKMLRIE